MKSRFKRQRTIAMGAVIFLLGIWQTSTLRAQVPVQIMITQGDINTGTTFCAEGGDLTFQAKINCANPPSSLTVSWTIGTFSTTGNPVSQSFTTPGNYTASVSLLNAAHHVVGSAQQAFTITGHGSVPNGVIQFTYPPLQPVPGFTMGGGDTEASDPDFQYTAYCTSTGFWKLKITKANEQIYQTVNAVPSVDVTAQLVAATTDCDTLLQMIHDLQTNADNPSDSAVGWFMTAAIQAHEDVHVAMDKAAFDQAFITFSSTVEVLTINFNDAADENTAKLRIFLKPEFGAALVTFNQSVATGIEMSANHQPPQPFIQAEHQIVDPMVTTILQRRQALGCGPPP